MPTDADERTATDAALVTGSAVATDAEPLGRNRDFRALLASQGISSFGDAVALTALPLLVLALTGSGLVLGVVLAIQALSDFVFSLFAGAVADRGDRKRMMIGADLGRAVLTALIPLAVIVEGPTVAVILIVAAPLSILRALFRAGYIASIPSLVGRPHLARANAILETVYSTAFIVGPAIAGLLATSIGPGLTLAIDAASFALSALGLALITRDLRPPGDRPRARMIDDIREGIGYIARHPLLRAAILLFALYSTVTTTMIAALAVRITRDLAQPESVFGLVLAGLGVGTLLGSIAATRFGHQTNVALVLLAGIFAMGGILVGVAIADSVPVIAGLAVLGGAAEALVTVVYVTLRTAYSPDALLGRIGSTARVVSLGLQPIGMVLGGLSIDTIGGTETLAVMGAGVCALALLFVPVRVLRGATLVPRAS